MTIMLERIFSIKNEGNHKVVRCFGAKLKIKNKNHITTIRQEETPEAIKKAWQEAEENSFNNFITSEMYSQVNENSICIDCGANVGTIAGAFANKGATVYAFEPNPECFEELAKKFKGNSKIHLFQKGVLDRASTMKLYKSIYHNDDTLFFSQSSSLYSSKNNIDSREYFEVECIDLIDFIKNLNQNIMILKIDVEGAEFQILEKLINEKVYEKIKYILVETHDETIPEIKKIASKVRNEIKELNITNINLDWI